MSDTEPGIDLSDRSALSRRAALRGGAAVLVGAAAASTRSPRAAAQPGTPESRRTVAFLTDTHVDPENARHLTNLRAVFAAIEADRPDLVLHGGDVTEYGSAAEYQAYLDLVPGSLRDIVWHVPGNHEIRWDVTAAELYERYLDQRNVEVHLAGIQFLLLDPTIWQQEVGYYTEQDLAWLRRKLQNKSAKTPTVLVTHYPMAEGHYYVVNTDDLLRTIEGRNVQLVLAGHTHRQLIDLFNGLTQLEGAAVKNAAQYYRLTVVGEARRPSRLLVEHVGIDNPERPEDRRITEVVALQLDDHRGHRERQRRRQPDRLRVRVRGDELLITAVTSQPSEGLTARCGIYQQQLYAGSIAEKWTQLTRRGRSIEGSLDISGLPPGEHRVNVEFVDGDSRWRVIETFRIDSDAYRPVDDVALGAIITGGTVRVGNRVVVPGAVNGVTALQVGRRLTRAWEADTGPVLTNLAVSEDESLLVAGSADGYLIGLEADSGKQLWRTGLGGPVMADPAIFKASGRERVAVMVGAELVLLDASGEVIWSRPQPGISAGRVAADDELIFLGTGDGKARAVRIEDGSPVWEVLLADRPDAYRRLIYGPWTTQATVIDDRAVFVATVSGGYALDRASGEQVWAIEQSYLYSAVRPLAGGDLLLIDEWGAASRVEAATGNLRWTTDRMVSRSLDAAPVIDGETAYVIGTMGDLAVLDLATGEYRKVRQLSASPVISSPTLIDSMLISAHLDGRVLLTRLD
ncbi:outer membrane protein assembly factor BamB/predicted MPP superfamily phosphohydrolase [Naumannella cuiyingiana]|uniref:Outer membrane protein assembly factor BamB/predicted MPP superfamily phosphohydrolase n=1 Tax=Naumannella cuiyingiana TaxID=1347891 RepID=A0A7Z0IL16_9ACTN|nr:outer membrane protein assembly factor BamB/predicted MPP superfamily phosphohydrolase [Naumannella cuiyingiana]